jgi:hypothetical protein
MTIRFETILTRRWQESGTLNENAMRSRTSPGFIRFGQHDDESVKLIANDGSGLSLAQNKITAGHLEALFLEDQYKALSWLTLTAGIRLTHFSGAISENAASPGPFASRIWVLRGFWGKYYQAPPLSTVTGPLLDSQYRRALDSFLFAASGTRNSSSGSRSQCEVGPLR